MVAKLNAAAIHQTTKEREIVAEVLDVEPVIRFCAVISKDQRVRDQAIERLADQWGAIAQRKGPFPFIAGGYYTASMGDGLMKDLISFSDPVDCESLADWKLWTNQLERELLTNPLDVQRPLNLDPGYITQAKLVLATTKDRDHRIYLRDGIFGEITLTYRAKKWVHHRWTYPDYRADNVAAFATECRNHLREKLKAMEGFRRRRNV